MVAAYRRIGLCLLCFLVAFVAAFAMPTVVHAQARREATKTLSREKELAFTIPKPIPGIPELLTLAESEQAVTLLSQPVNLVATRPTEFPPNVLGGFRYRVDGAAGFPIHSVEGDFLVLSDPSFRNAVAYLHCVQGVAVRGNAIPGPLDRGIAALAAYSILYRTDQAWSHSAKEELAAYYLLKAINGGESLGLSPDSAQICDLLRRYLGAKSSDAANVVSGVHWLMDSPPRVVKPQVPRGAVKPPERVREFRLLDIMVPTADAAIYEDTPPPETYRQAATRIINVVQSRPELFAHLPARYRLLRHCRVVALGREAVWIARKNLGKDVAEDGDPRTAQAKLESLCRIWKEWFDEEVKIRGNSQHAMPTAEKVGWDPHALAELTALLIDNSVKYAELVRVPVAENPEMSPADAQQLVRRAFSEDSVLSDLFKRYGAPAVEIVTEPSSPSGLALVLHWKLGPPGGKVVDHVWLQLVDTFSRGGDGLPVEPGLVHTQRLPARKSRITDPQGSTLLANLEVGAFVESLVGLVPGIEPPPGPRRWHQVGEKKVFRKPLVVELMMEPHGSLQGTASQEVWAKTTSFGSKEWKWTSLAELRTGDTLWHVDQGPCEVTGSRRTRVKDPCVRLTLAGTENTHVNKFVVHCENKPLIAESVHGILADTMVLLTDQSEKEVRKRLEDIDANLEERRFVRCPGFSTATAQVRRRRDLLIDIAEDAARVIYWVGYELDGRRRSIGVNFSHGFLVQRKGKTEIVPAQQLAEGDRLVCDEGDTPPATVFAVAIEECPAGRKWQLRHPRLMRCEWIQGNGVLVHTAQRELNAPGVLAETGIAVARGLAEEGAGLEVDGAVPITKLIPFDSDKVKKDPDFRYHTVLSCWPDARAQGSDSPEFMARAIEHIECGVAADVVRVVTDNGRVLCCGPGTVFWKRESDVVDGWARIGTVRAADIRPGDRILALTEEKGPPAPHFVMVVSVDMIDAFETAPKKGYFELFVPSLLKNKVDTIARFQGRYNSLFANSLLVELPQRPAIEWDKFPPPGEGPGPGPGKTRGMRHGVIDGFLRDAQLPKPSQTFLAAFSGNWEDRRTGTLPLLDAGEVAAMERSLESLATIVRESLAKSTVLPNDIRRRQRWARFADGLLSAGVRDMETALDPNLLDTAFDCYCDYRSLLIRTGHPQALEAIARIGVPLSYMLYESGRPEAGRALLDDLLAIQMRLSLRPRAGKALWTDETLLIRSTVRFAIEFAKLDKLPSLGRPEGSDQATVELFWNASCLAHFWSDILHQRIQDGEIHQDVIAPNKRGDEGVLIYNMLLQMDNRSHARQAIKGFVSPGFEPDREFSGEIRDVFRPVQH